MNLYELYNPLVSEPFRNDSAYSEYKPSAFLKPFIACFWGTKFPAKITGRRICVIPDGCMDILVIVNHTKNTIKSTFTGIQSQFFYTDSMQNEDDIVSIFAIRFYFWAVKFFTPVNINEEGIEPKNILEGIDNVLQRFFEVHSIYERIKIIENFFTGLSQNHIHDSFMNAVYDILLSKGTKQIKEIVSSAGISQRQLERLFLNNACLTIKKISDIVRYQNVWSDIIFKKNNILDMVEIYKFTDQAHLLNNFKKFHGEYPSEVLSKIYNTYFE